MICPSPGELFKYAGSSEIRILGNDTTFDVEKEKLLHDKIKQLIKEAKSFRDISFDVQVYFKKSFSYNYVSVAAGMKDYFGYLPTDETIYQYRKHYYIIECSGIVIELHFQERHT
jgi:hypothetical protein